VKEHVEGGDLLVEWRETKGAIGPAGLWKWCVVLVDGDAEQVLHESDLQDDADNYASSFVEGMKAARAAVEEPKAEPKAKKGK